MERADKKHLKFKRLITDVRISRKFKLKVIYNYFRRGKKSHAKNPKSKKIIFKSFKAPSFPLIKKIERLQAEKHLKEKPLKQNDILFKI